MAKKTTKKQVGWQMTPSARKKYADLFITRLDTMEKSEWTQPWVSPHNGQPCNLYRRNKPYRRTNAFLLTMLMQVRAWNTPFFITKKQMDNEDGNYKYKGLTTNASLVLDENGMPVINDKGMPEMNYERRFPVSFRKPIHKDADGNVIKDSDWEQMSDDEKQDCHTIWLKPRFYLVWNIEQTNFKELYPDDWKAMTEVPEHDYAKGTTDDVLERMIMQGEWRCPINFGGQSAYYERLSDRVQLPNRSQFLGDEKFYACAIHEMIHSTQGELGRQFPEDNGFGSPGYAKEEFVAELSSAIICSVLGIGKLLDDNHIAYVDNWRHALREDKDFIPVAMEYADKAVNYFMRCYDEVAQASEVKLLPAAA